jgi:hypothetical protein
LGDIEDVKKLTAVGMLECAFNFQIAALNLFIGLVFDIITKYSRTVDAEQLKEHVHGIYAIPAHRGFMCIDSSSKPILADAAAQ